MPFKLNPLSGQFDYYESTSNEAIDDRVAALLTEGKAIDLDYNDGAGTLTITGHTNQIIYNSSGGTGLLRFNTWSNVITYLALVGSDCDIIIEQNETIPAGSYDLKRARFVGNNGLEYTSGGWTVTFGDNTTISAWETPSAKGVRLLSTSTTGNIFTSSSSFTVGLTAVAHIHSTSYPFFKFTGSGSCTVTVDQNARFQKLGGGVENVDITSSAFACQLILFRGQGATVTNDIFKSTNTVIYIDVVGSSANDLTNYPTTNTNLTAFNVNVNFIQGTTTIHNPTTKSGDFNYTRASELYAVDSSGAVRTGSLPAATASGVSYLTYKSDTSANNVIIDAAGSDTIDGAGNVRLRKQYDLVALQDVGSGVWKIVADTRNKILNSGVATVGNVGTGEDDLQTATIPANTLVSNGDSVRIEAQLSVANNANQKRIKLYFGSVAIFDTGATGLATGVSYAVNVEVRVLKDGSSTQRYLVNYTATPSSGAAILGNIYGTASQTDTSSITVKCTGETNAASDNDVTNQILVVRYDSV